MLAALRIAAEIDWEKLALYKGKLFWYEVLQFWLNNA